MVTREKQRAILLFSGGPDSSTLVGWAVSQGYEPILLKFQTRLQVSDPELKAAKVVAESFRYAMHVCDLRSIRDNLGGMMVDPRHAGAAVHSFGSAVFLSIASAYAIFLDAKHVLIALHAEDAEASPEYRPAFLEAIQKALAIARGTNDINIGAPFIKMSKTEVFALGNKLDVPLHLTWSCTNDGKAHCGGCVACQERIKAFKAAALVDKTKYRIKRDV